MNMDQEYLRKIQNKLHILYQVTPNESHFLGENDKMLCDKDIIRNFMISVDDSHVRPYMLIEANKLYHHLCEKYDLTLIL